jgi:hypothetical protein
LMWLVALMGAQECRREHTCRRLQSEAVLGNEELTGEALLVEVEMVPVVRSLVQMEPKEPKGERLSLVAGEPAPVLSAKTTCFQYSAG